MKGKSLHRVTVANFAVAFLAATVLAAALVSCGNPWWPHKDKNPGGGGFGFKVTYHPDAAIGNQRAAELSVTGDVPVDLKLYAEGDEVRVLTNTVADTPKPLLKPGYVFAEWVDHYNYIEQGSSLTSDTTFTIDGHKDLYALWIEEDKVVSLRKGNDGYNEEMGTKKVTIVEQQETSYDVFVLVQQMIIINQSGENTGPLYVTITGDKDAFDVTGISEGPQDAINNGSFLNFTVKPKAGLLPGNYSIKIEVEGQTPDGERVYAAFIAGFVVLPETGPVHTVSFDANGGTGTVPAPQRTGDGYSVILPGPDSLTKPGFIFGGWNTSADGTGLNYAPGAAYKPTGNETLYANWVVAAGPPYHVTYSRGDVDSGTVPIDNTEYDAGATVTVPGNTGGLRKNGYTFLGWKTPDGTVYPPGMTFAIDSEMNFTPAWVPNANGLAVTVNGGNDLIIVKEAFYGYIVDSGLYVDITLENPSNTNTIGPFYITELKRQEGAFDLKFLINGVESDMPPFAAPLSSVSSRAAAAKGQQVTGAMVPGEKVYLRIKPHEGNPVRIYHLTCTIADAAAKNGASFAMTFNVKPIPLTVEMGGPVYSNPNKIDGKDYLSPIDAPALNYTEREVRFTVTVGGFASTADANAAGLKAGLLDKGAVNTAGFTTSGGGVTNGGSPTATSGGRYQRAYNVTVALADTTPFPTGAADIYVGIDIAAGSNYDPLSRTEHGLSVTVRDGQAATASQQIPVLQTNALPFNTYAGTATGLTRHYKQTENITLAAGAANWTAIGTASGAASFSGSYDGGNYKINNLTVNGGGNQGMFGYNTSTVKNIALVGGSVTGSANNIGGVVGANFGASARVENCSTSGTVNGRNTVGGIVGHNSGTVTGSHSTGNVTGANFTGEQNVGGVIGYNGTGATVENSYSTGDVWGNSDDIGGVVGKNWATVQNCYATGDVTGKGNYTGGVVGRNDGGTALVTGSRYEGAQGKAVSGTSHVGGVVGFNTNTNATVISSYSTGEVKGDANVGGVVGYNNTSTRITSSHSTATVKGGVDGKTGAYVGGIAGQNSGGTIDGCTYDGAVQATGYRLGGIVGNNISGGKVTNSKSKGTVIGDSLNVGGIVGMNSDANTLVQNCESSSAVSTGFLQAGGIAGQNQEGAKVLDSRFSGSVKGSGTNPGGAAGGYGYGGIAGHNLNGSEVRNCSSSGTVEGTTLVGGVVGRNYSDANKAISTITSSSSSSTVTGSGESVGGVVGLNSGSVTLSYATGEVKGEGDHVGGVAGWNNRGGAVQNCFATGNVTGDKDWVGGVTGRNLATLTNSYATGTVKTTGTSTYTGGVSGSNGGTIQNCYATGAVTGSNYTGGAVGYNDGGTSNSNSAVQNSVALSPSVTGNGNVGRVVGRNSGTATHTNVHARADMKVNNNTVTDADESPENTLNGKGITATDWNSAAWWKALFGADNAAWVITDSKLPTLKGIDAVQNPAVVP